MSNGTSRDRTRHGQYDNTGHKTPREGGVTGWATLRQESKRNVGRTRLHSHWRWCGASRTTSWQ